jgi:hypothetical protein
VCAVRRDHALIVVLALALSACSFDGSNSALDGIDDGGAVADGGSTFGGLPDGGADAASLQGLPDAAPGSDAILGGVPDAARPDAALPDAALPDAARPDAALPDGALPDADPGDLP